MLRFDRHIDKIRVKNISVFIIPTLLQRDFFVDVSAYFRNRLMKIVLDYHNCLSVLSNRLVCALAGM